MDELERLRALEALAAPLPDPGSALDVRGAFVRLSESRRSASRTSDRGAEGSRTVSRRALVTLAMASMTLAPGMAAGQVLKLSLADATMRALERNHDIAIQREAVHVAEEAGRRAEGAYDLQLRADGRARSRTDPVNTIFSGAPGDALGPRYSSAAVSASLSRLFSTGATAAATTSVSLDTTNSLFTLLSPAYVTAIGVELRQPLLQGRRVDAARRAIRVAAVDRRRSSHALRRTVTETIAGVERAYWTLVAARRDVDVRRQTIDLAGEQRADTQVRIEAGTAAETDLAQPVAEIERRKGDLFASREAVARAEHALKAIVLESASDPLWDAEIDPTDDPDPVPDQPAARDAVARALDARPELAELSDLVARQDVEIDAARERVRPSVDLVAGYALRGLAGSRNENLSPPFPIGGLALPADLEGPFGQSYANLFTHRFADVSAGVSVSLPIGNRAARADLASAEIGRRQATLAVEQAKQRIAAEVRNAVAALVTAAQRIESARAGREAAAVQLQAERDRFEAGLSTSFFVLTRQNDLAVARLAETSAVADHRKAATELARAMGTLLDERHITIETMTPP